MQSESAATNPWPWLWKIGIRRWCLCLRRFSVCWQLCQLAPIQRIFFPVVEKGYCVHLVHVWETRCSLTWCISSGVCDNEWQRHSFLCYFVLIACSVTWIQCLKGLEFGIIHHVLVLGLEGQVLDLGLGQCVLDSNTGHHHCHHSSAYITDTLASFHWLRSAERIKFKLSSSSWRCASVVSICLIGCRSDRYIKRSAEPRCWHIVSVSTSLCQLLINCCPSVTSCYNWRTIMLVRSYGTVSRMTLHHWQYFGKNWKHVYFSSYIQTSYGYSRRGCPSSHFTEAT